MHSGTALIDHNKIFSKLNLVTGTRVADLGCGRTGHFVFAASQIVGEKGLVYAVDIIKNVLESIKSRARTEGRINIQTVWSDLEKYEGTPIPKNSLDCCFFVNVFSLLQRKAEAMKEALRLLKKNGVLVIVEWEKRLGTLGPSSQELVSSDNLTTMAAKLSANVDEKISLGDYHYCLFVRKV